MLNNLTSSYSYLYGDVPVASVGIAKKIDMLPMNVGMGLCQGMMPLVAYNFSAKNYKRMRDFTVAARTAGIAFAAGVSDQAARERGVRLMRLQEGELRYPTCLSYRQPLSPAAAAFREAVLAKLGSGK
jgi:hypothetical protein